MAPYCYRLLLNPFLHGDLAGLRARAKAGSVYNAWAVSLVLGFPHQCLSSIIGEETQAVKTKIVSFDLNWAHIIFALMLEFHGHRPKRRNFFQSRFSSPTIWEFLLSWTADLCGFSQSLLWYEYIFSFWTWSLKKLHILWPSPRVMR